VVTHHLAQVNVGRLRAPVDAPQTAAFMAALDPVNALADTAAGFVWRLQTDEGNATSVSFNDDPMVIMNMSVWESIDALADFVYRTAHTEVMRRRAEWFHRAEDAYLALWWVPAGHVPSVEEAAARLAALQSDGPTPYAFTFRERFPAPSEVVR
jgi:hypothetical protein